MRPIVHIAVVVLLVVGAIAGLIPVQAAIAQPADFPVAGGHFYTQTSSVPGLGFRVTNEGGVPFWDAFQRYGGVNALGYPMSRRFTLDGFTAQATQRAILQWVPGSGRVLLVNILDRLHDAGMDQQLAACCATPPPLPPSFDAGKTWERVVADRQALLNAEPVLRAAYFAVPNPLDRYGLPTSNVTDMGSHFAIRAQRTVLQVWKTDVAWARAGQVTIANSGDLARLGGLIPITALAPEQSTGGLDSTGPLSADQTNALNAAANAVRAATVRIIAPPASTGSGVIISGDGLVLTANHVVDTGERFGILLPDGRRFTANLVSGNAFYDVALLRIVEGANLPVASLGSSGAASRGDPVVALGYGARTAQDLDINPGRIVALGSSRRPGESARTTFLVSDVGLIPGFSGGPLVDVQGKIIGINTAVVTSSRGALLPGHSLSIAIDVALPIVRQAAAGSLFNTALGVTVADLPEELAVASGLSVNRGALVMRVAPRSTAEAIGLHPGDIVISANGREIYGTDDLSTALEANNGGKLAIQVVGNNGIWRTTEVSLGSEG